MIKAGWSLHALDLLNKRFIPPGMQVDTWFNQIANRATMRYRNEGEKREMSARYADLFSSRRFFPTSAALHNITTGKGSLSGCIVLPLSSHPQDVIEHDLPKINRVLMHGIGVGLDLSNLPPRLSFDSRSKRSHIGPVEVIQSVVQATSPLAEYGGVKRAAYMGALSATHPDIGSFIKMKSSQKLTSINVSVSINSEFKEALANGTAIPFKYSVEGRSKYLSLPTLFKMKQEAEKRGVQGPDLEVNMNGDVRSRSLQKFIGTVQNGILCVNPALLFSEIARNAHACGDPGLLDLERINRDNPTHPRFSNLSASMVGVDEIHVTTPCGEQPLLPYEVCHLGSFNLSSFVEGNRFNFEEFNKTIPTAVQLMDDLIDLSNNELPEANELSKANRKIGIGLMGLADAFAKLDLPYGSNESCELAEKVAYSLQSGAEKASMNLALKRGAFKTFSASKYAFFQQPPRRNATLTTIAPTGHISTLADCSPSIEPYYKIVYGRNAAGLRVHENEILQKKLSEINYSLEEWIHATKIENPSYQFDGTLRGLTSNIQGKEAKLNTFKEVFVTADEIRPVDHLKMVALFQKYLDNGVSKTINLPNETTVEEVALIYKRAIELGLKGITVYRDMCQESQALFSPGECLTCEISNKEGCMTLEYTHMLKCLDYRGKVKYTLPAVLVDETSDYWIYYRSNPIVHHERKRKEFVLPHSEFVLVGKEKNHCISIAFEDGEAKNMYVNINLPPEKSEDGHQWRDLELDIRLTKKSDGSWNADLLDEEEFKEADLTQEMRNIAEKEISFLYQKIGLKKFPFCEDLSSLARLID